jgi:hypothetical protein
MTTPNRAAMSAHLNELFSPKFIHKFPDAKIEIAHGNPAPNRSGFFSAFEIDKAIEFAAEKNAAGDNVYVRATLLKGDTFPGGRSKDEDFLAASHAWVDCDEAGAADKASAVTDAMGLKPSLVVVTGETPHKRAHLYFALDGVVSADELVAANKALVAAFNGDNASTNAGRILRLAGSVSYPNERKVARGYIAETTRLIPQPGAAAYSVGEITKRTLPFVSSPALAPVGAASAPSPLSALLRPVRTDHDLHDMLAATKQPGAWHGNMRSVVATLVGRGHSDSEVGLICGAYCDGGPDDPDLLKLISTARRKWNVEPRVGEANVQIDPTRPLVNIRGSADFVGEYQPADYLIDGLMQRGFLYALCSPTGTGKTAVALHLSHCVATGQPFAGREVTQGSVLYAAGENPDDLRQRFIALCDDKGVDPSEMKIDFLTLCQHGGLFGAMQEIASRASSIEGGYRLVVVDTSAAFFDQDDENNNVLAGGYARRLRTLVELPGRPCVLVPAHPTKRPASQSECLPRGGGAFIAEIDGNFTLWPSGDHVELSWAGKLRGNTKFDAPLFELREVETRTVTDAKGRPVRTVLAKEVDGSVVAAAESAESDDLQRLLLAMAENPGARRLMTIAQAAGFLSHSGTEDARTKDQMRKRVTRRMEALIATKLVERSPLAKVEYRLTSKGEMEAARATGVQP